MRWKPTGAAAFASLLLALAACTGTVPGQATPAGGNNGQGIPRASDSSSPEGGSQSQNCDYAPTDSGNPNLVDVGIPENPEGDSQEVVLDVASSQGLFQMSLDATSAPCATNSMAFLADNAFFDGSPCHRLVDSEVFGVLQCGDPSGTGSGGPTYGYTFERASVADLEPAPDGASSIYPRGSVAMASGGQPPTIGSQFFICFVDTQLPPEYTLVGTITSGLEVIDAVAAGGNDGSFEPSPGGGAPLIPMSLVTVTRAN